MNDGRHTHNKHLQKNVEQVWTSMHTANLWLEMNMLTARVIADMILEQMPLHEKDVLYITDTSFAYFINMVHKLYAAILQKPRF